MAPRAKKANRLKRVDSVRASKDGHQFHEAWVARRALGLLLPRFDRYGITYSINSNRPFASELLEAFRSASTGTPAASADADAQLTQLRSAVKQPAEGLKQFADRVLLVGRMDSLEAVERGKRVAFRSRAWGRQIGVGDRKDSDAGAALFVTRPFLTGFLTATDRDLLLLIKLEHFRESERYNPADDNPSDRFTHTYSLLLVDRQLRVRPIVPMSADVATVASLDKYSIHDFQKRFTALSKSRGE